MRPNTNHVIASISTHFPIVAIIYEFEYGIDDYVIAKIGSAHTDSIHYVETRTARKYKLYTDKNLNHYFKQGNTKYYLNDAIKTL